MTDQTLHKRFEFGVALKQRSGRAMNNEVPTQ